eukprot:29123_1
MLTTVMKMYEIKITNKNSSYMEYVIEMVRDAHNIPYCIDAQALKVASADMCVKWMRLLPGVIYVYQCAVELMKGFFRGHNNGNIRDCGSRKESSIFTNNISTRDDQNICLLFNSWRICLYYLLYTR